MKLRKAYYTDLTGIILFCARQTDVLGPDDPPLNKGYLRVQLKKAIKSQESEVFLLVNKGQICGVLWAWLAGYAWSKQTYVTDILFLAERGGNLLMNAMKKWGKANGARRWAMQTHLKLDGERVKKLYMRKGLREVGSVMEGSLIEDMK